MARVVIVGASFSVGLGNSLATALRSAGHHAEELCVEWKPRWLAAAALRRPELAARFRRLFQRQVDVIAERGTADLVLVLKGAMLNSRSIDLLRSRFDSMVVCWNADSPFDGAISNHGGGIRSTVSAYDAYITWADDVAERLSSLAARTLVIPFAWDPHMIYPSPGQGKAEGRIVFVGTATKQRSALLESLAPFRPLVFGCGWPKMKGVEVCPPVRGEEFCGIAGEARWNINLLRPQNALSHNMRTFELVGAAGVQAAPLTSDHRRLLAGDSRTVLFGDKAELEAILRSDPRDLPSRSPAVLDGHTYRDRVDHLLAELGISSSERTVRGPHGDVAHIMSHVDANVSRKHSGRWA